MYIFMLTIHEYTAFVVSACIDDVAVWMKSNRLQLNATKTEVLWSAHPRRQRQLPKEPLCIGGDTVQPVQHVRNLGIYIDNGLTMNIHVSKTVASCFAALERICSIQLSVTRPVLLTLVKSLVLSCLDYLFIYYEYRTKYTHTSTHKKRK